MKKILVSLLVLLGFTQAVALEYEYVPFVREGVKWVYYYKNNGDVVYPADPRLSYGTVYLNLEIKGDTVIDGKIYKAMHKYHGDAINSENDTIPIFLREDDKVVYGLVPDGIKYPDCPIGNPYEEFLFEQIDNGEEFILYDFNDPINYWSSRIPKYNDEESSGYNYLYTDTIALGHHLAKRYVATRDYLGEFSMIEGIGVDARGPGYTLFPFRPMAAGVNTYFGFSHVIEDGEIIYKGVNYTEPEPNDSDGYLPIVREGVKWVNEKVIVNHGDTTQYYYNYEFSGKDTDPRYTNMMNDLFDACYYYLGDQLDVETDSLIAGLLDGYYSYDNSPGMIACLRNHAFDKVREENRQMFDLSYYLDGGTRKLYDFSSDYSTIHYYVNVCEYFWCQYGGFEEELTEENFIEIDPLMIEGIECSRYAFIDENGEPLAYVVEGIGFDSYDMGDLLTPFTRQPDHDADYQEWCGLSHVVKDGKIIYKGMRYRHGAFTGIDEAATNQPQRPFDPQYYNLMGQPVGKDVPTTPGIYIHNGKKICVSRMY